MKKGRNGWGKNERKAANTVLSQFQILNLIVCFLWINWKDAEWSLNIFVFLQNFRSGFPPPFLCVGWWVGRQRGGQGPLRERGGRGGCVSACSCNPTPAQSFPSTAQKKVFSSEIFIFLFNVVNPDPVIWQSIRQIFNSDPNVYLSHNFF